MLNPLVAVWMLIAIVLILTLPREKAITPFLLAFFTYPDRTSGGGGGLALYGAAHPDFGRIGSKGRFRGLIGRQVPGGFNAVDRVVVLWTVSALVILSSPVDGYAGADP